MYVHGCACVCMCVHHCVPCRWQHPTQSRCRLPCSSQCVRACVCMCACITVCATTHLAVSDIPHNGIAACHARHNVCACVCITVCVCHCAPCRWLHPTQWHCHLPCSSQCVYVHVCACVCHCVFMCVITVCATTHLAVGDIPHNGIATCHASHNVGMCASPCVCVCITVCACMHHCLCVSLRTHLAVSDIPHNRVATCHARHDAILFMIEEAESFDNTVVCWMKKNLTPLNYAASAKQF